MARPKNSEESTSNQQFQYVVTFSDGVIRNSFLVSASSKEVAIYVATPSFNKENKSVGITVNKITVVSL